MSAKYLIIEQWSNKLKMKDTWLTIDSIIIYPYLSIVRLTINLLCNSSSMLSVQLQINSYCLLIIIILLALYFHFDTLNFTYKKTTLKLLPVYSYFIKSRTKAKLLTYPHRNNQNSLACLQRELWLQNWCLALRAQLFSPPASPIKYSLLWSKKIMCILSYV